MTATDFLDHDRRGAAEAVRVPDNPLESPHVTHTTRFYLLAALIGALVGLLAAGFQIGISQAIAVCRVVVRHAETMLSVPAWLAAAVLTVAMLMAALYLVRRIAPEAGGSGVHEVEAHLDGDEPMRWHRVVPAKFVGGVLTLGAGATVGPEGPAVHMGGAVGRMVATLFAQTGAHGKALVCAGAAAGLAAVFSAPIAGFLFILEQMRRHFTLTDISFHGLVIASWSGAIVAALFFGQAPAFPVPRYASPAVLDLTLFVLLGAMIGAFGTLFNRVLLATLAACDRVRTRHPYALVLPVGLATGVLFTTLPATVGTGQALTLQLFQQSFAWQTLLLLLAVRLVTTIGTYASGVPGGIFAPLLALGALAGLLAGHLFGALFPGLVAAPGIYALAAMGALFAATFRLPLTAIVLVLEITRSASVAMAIVGSCLAASLTAHVLGATPLYEVLLDRLRVGKRTAEAESIPDL